jgi:hypothetical protein
VAGAVTAVLGVMLLSAMGLGALLAASEHGVHRGQGRGRGLPDLAGHQDLSQQRGAATGPGAAPGRSFYLQGLLVGASNPKAVLFFAAFFPQFINPSADLAPQLAVLAATFVAFEFAVLTLCALGVSRLVPLLESSGREMDQPPLRRPVHRHGRFAAADAQAGIAWISPISSSSCSTACSTGCCCSCWPPA